MRFGRIFSYRRKSEDGSAMLEAAIAMPLLLMLIFFLPAIIPFMFNLVGTHYASTLSLREVAVTGNNTNGNSREQRLADALERNLSSYTIGVNLDDIDVSVIEQTGSGRQVVTTKASCLQSGASNGRNDRRRRPGRPGSRNCRNINITPNSFVSVSGNVKFWDFKMVGIPEFSSRTTALMRIQASEEEEENTGGGTL